MGQQVLSWIGGLSATVAIIAALLKGVHWLVTRRKTLVVEVSCHPFRNPPIVEESFEQQKAKIRTAINDFFARNPSQPAKGSGFDAKYEHARRLAKDVEWVFLENPPYLVSATKGCWFAVVQNTGDKKRTDIHLRLPGAVSAVIHHDKEEPRCVAKINEIVAIGELRPKGRCDITAWTHTDVTDWYINRVEVTHESGSGKVRGIWHADRSDIVVGVFIKKSLGVFAILFALLGLIFFLMWAFALLGEPKANQKEEGPMTPTSLSSSATQSTPAFQPSPASTTRRDSTQTPSDGASRKDFAEIEAAGRLEKKMRFNREQEEDYDRAYAALRDKNYPSARTQFEELRRTTAPPSGTTSQTSQLIDFQIYLTYLLEGNDGQAQPMMDKFQFTGDTPSLYYAQAAWEFKHGNVEKAKDWVLSARKIYSPALNFLFAESFYDLDWLDR